MTDQRPVSRRLFLQTTALTTTTLARGQSPISIAKPSTRRIPEFANAIGIVSASAHAQLTDCAHG